MRRGGSLILITSIPAAKGLPAYGAVAVGFSSRDAGVIGDGAFHQLPEVLNLAPCDRPP